MQKVKRLTCIPHFDRLVGDATTDDLRAIRRKLNGGNGAIRAARVRILLLLDQSEGICGQESEVRARESTRWGS